MRWIPNEIVRLAGALAALACLTGSAAAQERGGPSGTGPAPPFAVQGFRYQPVTRPGSDTVTHMNECDESACGPGSRVSYIFFAPKPHSFEEYKDERAKVEAFLRAKAPSDVRLEFDPPTMQRLGPVTIYEARRTQIAADGSAQIAISASYHTAAAHIDLISSSTYPKVAEGNARTFQALIIIWMAMRADRK